jgi:choline kinase
MTAVILAAGRGQRLTPVTGDAPKCLARIGGRTLLSRQIELLRREGFGRIVVVVGYEGDAVASEAGGGIAVVRNPRHAATNSLYSLWLARHLLSDGFVVCNCDVLCHPQLLSDLMTSRHDDALLYAPQLPEQVYSDEEMKVVVRKGRVVTLGKQLASETADGENLGIARFGGAGAAVLIDELSRHVDAGNERAWLPAAFASFAGRRPLFAVPTRGYPWIEIDSPEDYWRACSEVMPAIEGQRPSVALADAAVRRPVHHV